MIHFLVTNGALSTAVKFATTLLLGWLVKLVRTHVIQQRKTNELLRTDTPGGLRDVVQAIERKPPRARAKPPASSK